MRPKWHFVFKAFLAAIGVIILLLALLYLASFILFILRQTGVLFVLVFGSPGWHAFFVSLPWLLIFLLFVFIVILEILVRRYSFAYRQPLLYSAIGIVIFVLIGGYIVAVTPLHGRLFMEAERNKLPFVGQFYREYGQQRFRDIHRGIITEIIQNGFVIKNRRGEMLTVMITRRTRLPLGADFSEGDLVIVFGNRDDDTVKAFGVQEVDE